LVQFTTSVVKNDTLAVFAVLPQKFAVLLAGMGTNFLVLMWCE